MSGAVTDSNRPFRKEAEQEWGASPIPPPPWKQVVLSGAHSAFSQIPSSRAVFSWMLLTDEWAFLFDSERGLCARPFGETPPINPTYLHLQRTLWIAQAAGEKGFVLLGFCHHKPCLVLRQLNPGPFIFSPTALGLPFALPWVKISRHGLCDLILPGLLDVISLFREPRKKEKKRFRNLSSLLSHAII